MLWNREDPRIHGKQDYLALCAHDRDSNIPFYIHSSNRNFDTRYVLSRMSRYHVVTETIGTSPVEEQELKTVITDKSRKTVFVESRCSIAHVRGIWRPKIAMSSIHCIYNCKLTWESSAFESVTR